MTIIPFITTISIAAPRLINDIATIYWWGVNTWDNGAVGNYWDDYLGNDLDGNGIGDTPYVLDTFNKDNFPLKEPWNGGRKFSMTQYMTKPSGWILSAIPLLPTWLSIKAKNKSVSKLLVQMGQ